MREFTLVSNSIYFFTIISMIIKERPNSATKDQKRSFWIQACLVAARDKGSKRQETPKVNYKSTSGVSTIILNWFYLVTFSNHLTINSMVNIESRQATTNTVHVSHIGIC